jgi:predicted transcriptional regulator
VTKKKATKTPNVYEGKWTPLFEDVPAGMSLYDIAVYGFVRRMEQMDAKKSTASAETIASVIHAHEKTVDRSLAQLEKWNVIKCVHRGGKGKGNPSHYVSRPRQEWDENAINNTAQEVTKKRRIAAEKAAAYRDSLSSYRDSLSNLEGLPVQKEGLRVPIREYKRVLSKRVKREKGLQGNEINFIFPSSPNQAASAKPNPDATHPPIAPTPLPSGALSQADIKKLKNEWKRKQKGDVTVA